MSSRLRRGVGSGLSNLPEDVATVQFLLQHVPDADGGCSTLTVSGTFDQATEDAVKAFQQRHLGFQDAEMEPGDITMLRLQTFALANNNGEIFARARHKVTEILGFNPAAIDSFRQGADGVGLVLITDDASGRNIYSHPLHGTWEVDGSLLAEYKLQSEEAGPLGYPISGERNVNGEFMNWFERGRIILASGASLPTTEIFS